MEQNLFDSQNTAMADVLADNAVFKSQNGRARRVFVLTAGCQQNEADSERLLGMAVAMGYEKTESPEDADLIIVNTCAIREHAERKILSILGGYKHIREKNPDLIVAVGGCMVVQSHRQTELKQKYPAVTFTFGPSSLYRFPSLLCEALKRRKRTFLPDETEYLAPEGMPVVRESTYRAWVSIMYGCNNFCSYCIVPYVRGRERSRHKEDVVAEVRGLVAEGYKDITLLGQNVNSYAKNTDWGYDFADLLAELDAIEGDFVLRFMTSHPKDASHKLIDVMASSRHIAHQFHLPMQSGSDAVLKAMNRHYDMARYMDSVNYMREKMPDVTLTSDIIVGFPTETDADFEATMQALDNVQFDMLYSFKYSRRKGTPADKMEQVDDAVVSARFERLLEKQNTIGLSKNQTALGTTMRVLCDGVSKNNDALYSGRNDGNKIVFFDGTPEDVGSFVTVKVERCDAFSFYGKKVNL